MMTNQEITFMTDFSPFDYLSDGLPAAQQRALVQQDMLLCNEILADGAASTSGYDAFESLFGFDPFALAASGSESVRGTASPMENAASAFDLSASYATAPSPAPVSELASFEFKEEPRIPMRPAASSRLPAPAPSISTNKRERNRLAAERCRQRKADLIGTLQKECDELRLERERLLADNARLLRALGLR